MDIFALLPISDVYLCQNVKVMDILKALMILLVTF